MSNKIVEAFEQVTEKLTKNLGKDGSEAVEKLYRMTGETTEDITKRVGSVDEEHQGEILNILKKMDENASKDGSTPLKAAENDRERAMLRQKLAKALGYDGKSSVTKEAVKDVDDTKTAVAAEAEKAGHVTMVGKVNGRPAALKAHASDGVNVSGLDDAGKLSTLRSETKGTGDVTLHDEGISGQKPGCSCGLLHNDSVSTHTSMSGANKQLKPNVHPALQNVLNDIKQRGTPLGQGHGNCGEVGVISDKLWELDPDGTKITTLDQLKAAMKNPDGSDSAVYSTIIDDMKRPDPATGVQLSHGDYLPPCASCNQMLHDIEVTPVR